MGVSAAESSRRASYGRGVADGLRMAGVTNPGEYMNASKLARVESGLNTMARKVLEAVPKKEVWTKSQIARELHRSGSSSAGRDVVDGCLNTLKESGLIREPEHGSFIRVSTREPTVVTVTKKPFTTPTAKEENEPMPTIPTRADAAAPVSPEPDTLSRLANLGALLRRAADECDAIALDVESRVQAAKQDGEQLRQLKQLLKSIGD